MGWFGKKAVRVHDVYNENGLRITSEGNVFVHSDAGEIALILKKAELGRLTFDGFSVGRGKFAEALLGDQYPHYAHQLNVQDFALDLSSRAVVAEYFGNPRNFSKWGSANFPRFSPAAKETLKQKHQLSVDNRLTLEAFSPHEGENQAICFFGGESNDGYAKGHFWLDLDKSSQKKDALRLRLNMAPEMLAEKAFSSGVNLSNLDIWITEGGTPDNYRDSATGKSAAPRTDGGEHAFLQINIRSGEATLVVEDKNQQIVQKSSASLGVADADFIQRIQSRLSQKKQTSPQTHTSNTNENPATDATTTKEKVTFAKTVDTKVGWVGVVAVAVLGALGITLGAKKKDKKDAKEGEAQSTGWSGIQITGGLVLIAAIVTAAFKWRAHCGTKEHPGFAVGRP